MSAISLWTEKIRSDSRVLDPLGLGYHLNIQRDFVPAITSVTKRMRYYTMQAWFFKNRSLKEDPKRLERLFILATLNHHNGDHTHPSIRHIFNKEKFKSDWNDRDSFSLEKDFKISGFARAQLYRFIVENNLSKEVVAFATDSICVTKKLDVDSKSLGEFHFEKSAKDVFYLQNGFYRFDHTWKQRGLGKLGSKEIEHIDTFERGGKLLCQLEVKRNTRLRSSILQDNLSEIGKIKSITKEINLNADRKRFWLGKIENIEAKAMNESVPISLNHFTKDQI